MIESFICVCVCKSARSRVLHAIRSKYRTHYRLNCYLLGNQRYFKWISVADAVALFDYAVDRILVIQRCLEAIAFCSFHDLISTVAHCCLLFGFIVIGYLIGLNAS